MSIYKRLLVFVLALGLMLPNFLINSPKQAKAAGCSITLTGKINGDKIDFSWTVSGYTPKAGDFYALTAVDPFFLSPGQTSMSVNKPSARASILVNLSTADKKTSCQSNSIVFSPPNTLTGGSGGSNACGHAPSLTIKSAVASGKVTVELGWENQSTSTITADRAKVYIDGKEAGAGDLRTSKYFYYKHTFPDTETHSYQVTQLLTSSTTSGVSCETPKSNEVRYNGTTKTNEGALPKDKSDEIFKNVTPPAAGSDCTSRCALGFFEKFSIGPQIKRAICELQCTVINWLSSLICTIIINVLYPSLGLDNSGDSFMTTCTH